MNASGGYDHHLRNMRRTCASHLQLMSAAALRHFPENVRLSRPAGGFFLWIEMPGSVDALRLHEDALRAGISTAPGPLFSARARFKSNVRLNCAVKWTEKIEAAIATLGRLAHAQMRHSA
ncbi:MAG: hypothetical protein ACREIA_21520 [Opitutaceae bacterium]